MSSASAVAAPKGGDKLQRSLVTPEGVDLRLRLASASERIGAFVLDLLIMGLVLVGLVLVAISIASELGSPMSGGILFLVGFFLLRNFYFVLFELRPRGASLGKRAMGLRVVAQDGGRLSADAVLARNLIRELEFFLPLSLLFLDDDGLQAWVKITALIWTGIFTLLPLFNRDRMRVGDLIGGTWVVHVPRRTLLPDLAHDGAAVLAFSRTQLDAYGVHELQTLETVLRAGDRITQKAVAERIRQKIGWTGKEGDARFLEAYYAALRQHLESRLLFGHRRRDKFDKA